MNRWQFYQRSTTKNYSSNDITTWSLEQLYNRITHHFEKSLDNEVLLQQISLAKYDPIIIKGNARYLRPALFDLLAFRALDYYRNDERYVTKPSYAFEINDSAAFAEASVFISKDFKTSDSLSLHHRALKLYQVIIAFHLKDQKPDALIDADINRLEFVRNFGTIANKDEMYKKALEKLIATYGEDPSSAYAYYHLAAWYIQKAAEYTPFGDTTYRHAYIHAKKIIDKAMSLKPSKGTHTGLSDLQRQIQMQNIITEGEQVNTIGEPFRVLVSYRNVKKAYAR